MQNCSRGNSVMLPIVKREAWKQEVLDDPPRKDERGPSSIRWTLKPFQRQHWGNFWEMGWSAHKLFRVHKYHIELSWTEQWMHEQTEEKTRQQVISPVSSMSGRVRLSIIFISGWLLKMTFFSVWLPDCWEPSSLADCWGQQSEVRSWYHMNLQHLR